jgi:hypothetical protein
MLGGLWLGAFRGGFGGLTMWPPLLGCGGEYSADPPELSSCPFLLLTSWGAIHQLLNIILKLRILVLLLVSTLPYVVKVKNYS